MHSFKGIRYGAPPVGPFRWMAPQRPTPSKVVLDCSDYGAPAMQMASGATAAPAGDYGMLMARVFTTPSELKIQNEDCLFLNVWTPATDNQKRPVMFWIHGGIFAYGSGGQPVYCMEDLARDHNVVAVNVNHRLNVFGYLHLGDLMGDGYKSSGTVGMQDLVLALQWVRDNIANFGGDPDNVTIMGQSGGGAKVSILMSMDSAKGLFHKASIQSGPGLVVGRREPATAAAKALLDELGIQPGDIKSLQGVPAQTIIAAAFAADAKSNAGYTRARVPGMRRPGGIGYIPIIDDVAITRDPFTPDAPAVSRDVPVLVGYVKDEVTIFTAGEPWFWKNDRSRPRTAHRDARPDGQAAGRGMAQDQARLLADLPVHCGDELDVRDGRIDHARRAQGGASWRAGIHVVPDLGNSGRRRAIQDSAHNGDSVHARFVPPGARVCRSGSRSRADGTADSGSVGRVCPHRQARLSRNSALAALRCGQAVHDGVRS